MTDQPPPSSRRQGRPPAGRSPSGAPQPAPAGGPADLLGEPQTALGLALIGLAVIIGLLLLVRGFTDGGDEVSTESETPVTSIEDVDRNAPPTLDPSASSSTTAATRAPSEVTVLVANAAGVAGAAGRTADALTAAGYTIVDTSNAPSTSTDQVFYSGELEPEAVALAESLGLESSAVSALPDPPPLDTLDADVLVMVGPNLASGELPTPTTTAAATTATTAAP